MDIQTVHKKIYNSRINFMIFLCAFLSSMVPRYISTFKIRLGINISLYTIAVVLTFVLFAHRFVIYKKVQSYFFAIWLLFVVLSIWRAEQIGEWAYYLDWILTAFLFTQILYVSDRDEAFNSLVKGLLCGLIIHLIVGFVEVTLHRYFFAVSIESRRYYGNVPVSIFHNPNDYVTFVVTIFPFAIYYLMKQKTILRKTLFSGVVFLSVYMMVRSMSRSAFLAMVLLMTLLIWLAYKKSSINKIYISLGVLILIGVLVATPKIQTSIFSSFMANQIDIASTDRARWNLIKNGLNFLKQTYGAGVGAGNLRTWLSERAAYNVGSIIFIHNWYVELLCTFGIAFFVLYIAFHMKVIIVLLRNYDPSDRFWNFDNTLLISFIGFSIVSIASSSNIYSEWVWMYLVFAGTYTLIKNNRWREKSKMTICF